MKQTAVKWLEHEIKKLNISVDGATQVSAIRIIEQAKEMEKEQIKEVFIDVSDVLLKETNTQQKAKIKQVAEKYYNETFKSE